MGRPGRTDDRGFAHENSHCYYKKQDLGACSNLFVSPTGSYAVFIESTSNLVHLYDVAISRSAPVHETLAGPILFVKWTDNPPGVEISAGKPGSEVTIDVAFPVGHGNLP